MTVSGILYEKEESKLIGLKRFPRYAFSMTICHQMLKEKPHFKEKEGYSVMTKKCSLCLWVLAL
ncbi:hypothetical protein RZ52_09155 [Bacillus velezensis]|nr:hypothetical protein RZ52_09155 [Bacillus velezensis]